MYIVASTYASWYVGWTLGCWTSFFARSPCYRTRPVVLPIQGFQLVRFVRFTNFQWRTLPSFVERANSIENNSNGQVQSRQLSDCDVVQSRQLSGWDVVQSRQLSDCGLVDSWQLSCWDVVQSRQLSDCGLVDSWQLSDCGLVDFLMLRHRKDCLGLITEIQFQSHWCLAEIWFQSPRSFVAFQSLWSLGRLD